VDEADPTAAVLQDPQSGEEAVGCPDLTPELAPEPPVVLKNVQADKFAVATTWPSAWVSAGSPRLHVAFGKVLKREFTPI